jgi:Flp pilus assembly protein TadD
LGKVTEAVRVYEELVEKGLADSGLYNHYGEALMQMNQYEKAASCFQEALKIDPSNTRARNNLFKAINMQSGKEA